MMHKSVKAVGTIEPVLTALDFTLLRKRGMKSAFICKLVPSSGRFDIVIRVHVMTFKFPSSPLSESNESITFA